MFESSAGLRRGDQPSPQAKDALLAELRQRMEAIPGRVETAAPATANSRDIFAAPGGLRELLPGLVRGTMVACPRGGVLCALLAETTAAGHYAAVVRDPDRAAQLGALAAWEAGADLRKLVFVDARPDMALKTLYELINGVPLIVLDIANVRVRPKQVELLRARIRAENSVLVVTSGSWARAPHLTIDVQRVATKGLGLGRGRLQEVTYELRVTAPGQDPHAGRVTLTSAGQGQTRWVTAHEPSTRIRLGHTG